MPQNREMGRIENISFFACIGLRGLYYFSTEKPDLHSSSQLVPLPVCHLDLSWSLGPLALRRNRGPGLPSPLLLSDVLVVFSPTRIRGIRSSLSFPRSCIVTRSLWQRWFSSSPDLAFSRRRTELKGRGEPPALEFLEDRLAPSANWNNFGGNAQHTDIAGVPAQPIDQLLWSTPLDLNPWALCTMGIRSSLPTTPSSFPSK